MLLEKGNGLGNKGLWADGVGEAKSGLSGGLKAESGAGECESSRGIIKPRIKAEDNTTGVILDLYTVAVPAQLPIVLFSWLDKHVLLQLLLIFILRPLYGRLGSDSLCQNLAPTWEYC